MFCCKIYSFYQNSQIQSGPRISHSLALRMVISIVDDHLIPILQVRLILQLITSTLNLTYMPEQSQAQTQPSEITYIDERYGNSSVPPVPYDRCRANFYLSADSRAIRSQIRSVEFAVTKSASVARRVFASEIKQLIGQIQLLYMLWYSPCWKKWKQRWYDLIANNSGQFGRGRVRETFRASSLKRENSPFLLQLTFFTQ